MHRVVVCAFAAILAAGSARANPPEPQRLRFAHFGEVTVYRPKKPATSATLFLSGDGGWNQGVVGMAQHIVDAGGLVVGIDVNDYRRAVAASNAACVPLAEDLERLSHGVERALAMPTYLKPVVVGYSSGATLAYAAIAQAPSGTFSGALSLGFCPDVEIKKPLCRTDHLTTKRAPDGKSWLMTPTRALDTPWTTLQGSIDEVCSAETTEKFVHGVPGAELVALPKVGHGFSVERNWLPQFRAAYLRLAAQPKTPPLPTTLHDLPLTEIPSRSGRGEWLAVMLSGDGGWAGLDKAVATDLAAHDVAVVGVSSLQYFWRAKTPEQAGADLARIIATYLAAWHKQRAIVIGYSFGAEVAPFMVNRLPSDIRPKVAAVALIGPGQTATFQFHMSEWLGREQPGQPLGPEVEALGGTPLLCLHGVDEADSLCPNLSPTLAKNVLLKGGHHYGGDYAGIASAILGLLSAPAAVH